VRQVIRMKHYSRKTEKARQPHPDETRGRGFFRTGSQG